MGYDVSAQPFGTPSATINVTGANAEITSKVELSNRAVVNIDPTATLRFTDELKSGSTNRRIPLTSKTEAKTNNATTWDERVSMASRTWMWMTFFGCGDNGLGIECRREKAVNDCRRALLVAVESLA